MGIANLHGGAKYTITNTGSMAINGWNLQFSFPNGQTIIQLWNVSYTQNGSAVTISDAVHPGRAIASIFSRLQWFLEWNQSGSDLIHLERGSL